MQVQKTFPTTGVKRHTVNVDRPVYNLVTSGDHINAKDAYSNVRDNGKDILTKFYTILDNNCIYTVIEDGKEPIIRHFYYDQDSNFNICNVFKCDCCGQEKFYISDFTTGYGSDKAGKVMCYECIAEDELKKLIAASPGYIKDLCMYLCKSEGRNKVNNWPGSLSFDIFNHIKGRHNIATWQYNFDFMILDKETNIKHYFHGRVCGDNTQIASIRKLK